MKVKIFEAIIKTLFGVGLIMVAALLFALAFFSTASNTFLIFLILLVGFGYALGNYILKQ